MSVLTKCVVLLVWVGAATHWMQCQSVAEAARQQKLKKQRDSVQTDKKPKVYTNDEIPESKIVDAPEQNKSGSESSGASSSHSPDEKHGEATEPAARDSGRLELKLSPATIKRPGNVDIDWFVHNTSDHIEKLDLTTAITGPCGFHEKRSSSFEIDPGSGLTDNTLSFVVYESNCPGTYNVEMQLSAKGKLLSSASAAARAE